MSNTDGAERIRFARLYADAVLPERATPQAAGYDLRAHLASRVVEVVRGGVQAARAPEAQSGAADGPAYFEVQPGECAKIPLGFRSQLPPDVEGQIRPRSGVSFRTSLQIANSPGTIDADYRGEWMILLRNVGPTPVRVHHLDAIAQVVFARVVHLPLASEDPIEDTSRGSGGFGSTGR